MNDVMILRRGGGIPKLFAAIGVTYPAGAAVTCSKGDKKYTAKSTSGRCLFAIPEAGEWTIAMDGKSETVNISQEGQIESLNFASLVLFDGSEGGDNSAVTGGWDTNLDGTISSTAISISDSVSGESNEEVYYYVCTKKKIPLADYSILRASVTASSSANGSPGEFPMLGISEDGETALAATEINGKTGSFELDVSGYSGEYYVGFFFSFELYGTYEMIVECPFMELA